jgi:large subunit ribosomal protein L24
MQKLKVGDTVQVLKGKESALPTSQRRGRVLSINWSALRVRVEGLRKVKRHTRKSNTHPEGGIIEKEGSIALANLAVVCPKCDKPNRMGIRSLEKEEGKVKKVRFCKGCEEALE